MKNRKVTTKFSHIVTYVLVLGLVTDINKIHINIIKTDKLTPNSVHPKHVINEVQKISKTIKNFINKN